MAELSNEKKRALAERLFINDGQTCKQIALDIDVSEVTLSRWRKGRKGEQDWDTRRAEVISSPHILKELLTKQLKLISEGEKPTIDADALIKISKVLETVSGKVSVQVVISVLKEFDNFMIDHDPELAVRFLEFHKKFILHKAERQ